MLIDLTSLRNALTAFIISDKEQSLLPDESDFVEGDLKFMVLMVKDII